MDSLEDKLKEVKEIRDKLIKEGYHMPISWEVEKSAITYNWKQQNRQTQNLQHMKLKYFGYYIKFYYNNNKNHNEKEM